MKTSIQSLVFELWSAVTCVIIAVYYLVYRRSKTSPVPISYDLVNRRRFRMFFGFVVIFLLLFVVALANAPYITGGEADDIIGVKARMFSFELTKDTVECGKLVEFRVSTEDVTHGFGVYNPQEDIIGQVQAMPGYVNRLRLRFSTPGRYNILCLEYCGPLHHQMRSFIIAR